jgi:5-formyltetrahydrofolate cyclo-ligase
LELGKQLAAPVVTGKHNMSFIYISSMDELKEGFCGILEPEYDEKKIALPTSDSLILVPGFAFDATLNRLGYGGGYYDKYMSENPEAYRIGIGFHSQYTQSPLPRESYDIPLDMLITDKMIKKGARK